MTRKELFEQIKSKRSFLCIGLDTDINKIPSHLLHHRDPVFEFNRKIIDATHDLCVAYKLNTAFYESLGAKGWLSLKKTWEYIPENIFTIADGKRGDIGNTSLMYAEAFFNKEKSGVSFDALTVAPYMGRDSVFPFLTFNGKWTILLAITSNSGSTDFQLNEINGEKLYETVIKKSMLWGNADNMMYVIGATHPEVFVKARSLAPHHFFLVPGVGTQGGELSLIAKNGMNEECGLLVNVSRAILYASAEKDFDDKAREEAMKYKEQMSEMLKESLLMTR